MPISMEEWNAAPINPATPTLPYQVSGGTPAAAAGTAQELVKGSAGEEQTHYAQGAQLAERAVGPVAGLLQSLKNAGPDPITGEEPDVFGKSYLGQIYGHGSGDIARAYRQHEIKVGGANAQKYQNWENTAADVDSSTNDATIALQSMYRQMGRGGGQSGQEGASETIPRGNLPILQGVLGNRQTDLRSQMLEKVKKPIADIFQNMGYGIDHGQYTTEQALEALSPLGFTRSQIVAGLKAHTSPWNLGGAGGADGANKSGPVAPAASPLPGAGGDHGDQGGAKSLPDGEPGRGPPRGNKMRPTYQAGFTGGPEDGGQGSGNVTNRTNMEPAQQGMEIPPMPKQIYQPRAFQYERAMQILQKNPELAGEIDKRLFPGFPGTAKQLLQKMQAGQ